MITIEVNGQFYTWQADFAVLMMRYYQKNGVSYTMHRHCHHTCSDLSEEGLDKGLLCMNHI